MTSCCNWYADYLINANIYANVLIVYFLLILKVTEMKAEYFPPKEDIILQNEAPTEFYVLVSGQVVSLAMHN